MRIRQALGAVTVAAVATLTGLTAGSASAAPPAPTLSAAQVVQGETVTARGTCPTTTANPVDSVDIKVDGLTAELSIPVAADGKYVVNLKTDFLATGSHAVTATCHGYLGDETSAEAQFSVLAPIESSIQIVDNNGGTLNTNDPVTVVATQKFNSEKVDYKFTVNSTSDVTLSDDEPRVKFARADGSFFELPVTFTKTSNPNGVAWDISIAGTIPAGTTLTLEANGTLTAPAGSVVTIADRRTGEAKEVTVGEAADVTLVVTPTEGAAGISVQIDATGLVADTTYEVFFHSLPVKVGEVTADANGEVHVTIVIPADAALGAHTIALVLNGEVIVSAPFHVTDAAAPTTTGVQITVTVPPTPAAPPAPPGLANTGFEAGPISGAAAGFIVLGGLLLVAARRRPAAHRH